MKSDMDMVIVHDGEKWIASNEDLVVEGRTHYRSLMPAWRAHFTKRDDIPGRK